MSRLIVLSCLLMVLMALIPGCHYYIDAVPHITLSSEPFAVHTTTSNQTTPTVETPLPQ